MLKLVRVAITIILAMAVAGCTASQVSRLRDVRAPPGWEPFCFPLGIQFVGETDTISDDGRELLRVVVDLQDYRSFQWFNLAVASGGSGSLASPQALVRRRAAAVLRILPEFGIRRDRVQVVFVPELSAFERDGAYLTVMIPPERVERLRILRETQNLIVC